MCSIHDKMFTSWSDLSWKKFRLLFILAFCRLVTYINKVHTRHLSCMVLVDIFWKIELVSVVDLGRGNWFVLNRLLGNCDFFLRKLGCDGFLWTTICRVMTSFHNFMFFIYFSIYGIFIFYFFCLAKK